MKIHYLAIGDEILTGRIHDANGQWLAKLLNDRGIRIQGMTTVGDHLPTIVATLKRLMPDVDGIVVSGGLGPTPDDLTREGIAQAIGVSLEFNEQTWSNLQARFTERGRTASPSHRHQCFFPKGSSPIHNPVGTASGVLVEGPDYFIASLPGVPWEFQAMVRGSVLDQFFPKGLSTQTYYHLFQIPESKAVDQIKSHNLIPSEIEWGTQVGDSGVSIRVVSPVDLEESFKSIFGSNYLGKNDHDLLHFMSAMLTHQSIEVTINLGNQTLRARNSQLWQNLKCTWTFSKTSANQAELLPEQSITFYGDLLSTQRQALFWIFNCLRN